MLVETFGTGKVSDEKLGEAVQKVFDLRPSAIIRDLDLRRPIYRQLAAYGHMGRTDLNVTWERTDRTVELLEAESNAYSKRSEPDDKRSSASTMPSPPPGGRGDYDSEKWLYVPDFYTEYRYILGTKGQNPLICIGINPPPPRRTIWTTRSSPSRE